MRAGLSLLVAIAMLLTSCGGGLSNREYAEEIEALAATTNGGLDRLDASIVAEER